MNNNKICKLCGLEKSLSEFSRQTGCKDGVRPYCKFCDNNPNSRLIRKKIREDKEFLLQTGRQKCTRCKQIKDLISFVKDQSKKSGVRTICCQCDKDKQNSKSPEEKRIENRKSTVRQYNLDMEELNWLITQQNNRCLICQTLLNLDPTKGPVAAIDHDHRCCARKQHSCGKCVRGVLCDKCNCGLGFFKDTPELLFRAGTYITDFNNHTRSISSKREKLLDLLCKFSLQNKVVTLSSGTTSDYYVNVKRTLLMQEGIILIANMLLDEIHPIVKRYPLLEIGTNIGGVFLSSGILAEAHYRVLPHIATFYTREKKDHGNTDLVEGYLGSASDIILIDDVISTGNSIRDMISKIELHFEEYSATGWNGKIHGIYSVVDRTGDPAKIEKEFHCPYKYLFTLDNLLDYKNKSQNKYYESINTKVDNN